MDLNSILLPAHSVELSVKNIDPAGTSKKITLKSMIETGFNHGEFKILAPIHHGVPYNLKVGEKLDVLFKNNASENAVIYSIRCLIVHRFVENDMPLITLKQISEPVKVQRRKAFRIHVYNTYSFEYKGKTYELVTKDLSSTGMLALTPIQLNTNTEFDILFDANIHKKDTTGYTEERIFNIRCRVLDSKPEKEIRRFINRIVFDDLPQAHAKLILQYLYNKQTEMIQSQPNLMPKWHKAYQESSLVEQLKNTPELSKYKSINLINLFFIFLTLAFYIFSQPSPIYGLDYFWGSVRPAIWHTTYLWLALLTAFLITVIGTYNTLINKNKNPSKRFSIFTICIGLVLIFLCVYTVIAEQVYLF